jgi:hypothetical protein
VDTSSNLGIHEQSLAIAYHILMSSSKVQIGIEVSMESRSVGFVHVPLIGCVNDADCSWSHLSGGHCNVHRPIRSKTSDLHAQVEPMAGGASKRVRGLFRGQGCASVASLRYIPLQQWPTLELEQVEFTFLCCFVSMLSKSIL